MVTDIATHRGRLEELERKVAGLQEAIAQLVKCVDLQQQEIKLLTSALNRTLTTLVGTGSRT